MDTPALYVLTLAAMMLTSAALVRLVPGIARLAGASTGRFGALDGLRGLLAASVLVHHAWIARQHYAGLAWSKPAHALYLFAGDGAVSVFFMITGLLFWDKALSGNLRFVPLLRSRLRRLLPLHLFCWVVVVTICLALATPAGPDPLLETVYRSLHWLLPFAASSSIDGVPTLLVDAGVTWSLSYEWAFYLLLIPLAAVFTGTGRFVGLAIGMSVLAWLAWRAGMTRTRHEILLAANFLGGMATARLLRTRWAARLQGVASSSLAACVVALMVVAVVAAHRVVRPDLLNLALTPAFAAIVLGCDLFGLLRTRWMRWLGHVSFSVYLLHGILLLGTLRLVDRFVPVARLDDGTYLVIVALIGAGVVCVASVTYELIERPFFDPQSRLRLSRAPGARPASEPAPGARAASSTEVPDGRVPAGGREVR